MIQAVVIMDDVKYPDLRIKVTGTDGNAYAVLGRVRHAMHDAGVSDEQVSAFTEEATSSGYSHLLRTCMQWVDIS